MNLSLFPTVPCLTSSIEMDTTDLLKRQKNLPEGNNNMDLMNNIYRTGLCHNKKMSKKKQAPSLYSVKRVMLLHILPPFKVSVFTYNM